MHQHPFSKKRRGALGMPEGQCWAGQRCSKQQSFIRMRSAGIYLLEVEIGQLTYNNLPPGTVLFSFRIGKSSTALALDPLVPPNLFAGVLKLNVDSSALETQRCSLSLSLGNSNRPLGVASINLPKDKNALSSNYPLRQSEDKKASVELKIRISPFDARTQSREDPVKEGNSSSMSNIKVKSKHSEGSGEGEKKVPRNYKIMEDERIMEITEREVKRYKAQKEAYYQMYQLEKAKNQVASKFISTVIKKLTDKYPHLLPAPSSSLAPNSDLKKKGSDFPKNRSSLDAAAIEQLEQANRSLHRQVQDYKKVVDQLKQQIAYAKPAEGEGPRCSRKPPSSFLDFGNPPRQSYKERSNIIPASLKENQEDTNKELKDIVAGVDLKKWLQMSVGQREAIQSKLSKGPGAPPERAENKAVLIKKVRSGMDRAFTQLLGAKQLTKSALLSHKQELNRILDDCLA